MTDVARRLVVRGRVHGVGYRDAMVDAASAAGAAGWVRNLRDGTVEAHVQGPREAVDRVLAWAGRGPPAAVVTGVEAHDVAVDAALRGFARR